MNRNRVVAIIQAHMSSTRLPGKIMKDLCGESALYRMIERVRHSKRIDEIVVATSTLPCDDIIIEKCKELGVNVVLSTVWAEGGKGGEALAREVIRLCEEEKSDFHFSYELDGSIEDKINAIVKKIYRGTGVTILPAAKKQIAQLTALGFDHLPVCMAKTQYSFSDDATKLGAPENFSITIKNVKISAGAGFVVVLTGDIMTMPGLSKSPSAERIDVDENGVISGLF